MCMRHVNTEKVSITDIIYFILANKSTENRFLTISIIF